MHYSLLNFTPFLPVSWQILSFFLLNSFENGQSLTAAFQNSSVQIRELYEPRQRGEVDSAVFKRVWHIKRFLVFRG
jgi:hypothetical protein